MLATFKADEAGYEAFSRYLAASGEAPIYFVVDVIEEDFRDEKVPHVRAFERKGLMERRLSQFFRLTPYRCARIQGREEWGRRDDEVLLSGLTQKERLSPWIELVLAARAPLAGITSAALLSESMANRMLGKGLAHVLLISHHQHSGLRQTYLRKGHVKFSRLTPFVPAPARTADPIGEALIEECRRTRQYLERQRYISHDEPLDIHVYAEPEDLERFRPVDSRASLLRIQVHDAAAEARAWGIKTSSTALGAFSHCLVYTGRSSRLPNHYAPPSMLRYQRIRQLRLGMILSSALVGCVTCFMCFGLVLEGFQNAKRHESLRNEARVLMESYRELRHHFPETPVPSELMQETVDTIEALRLLGSPSDLAPEFSRVLEEFPEVRVQKFAWETKIITPNVEASRTGKTPRSVPGRSETPPPSELLASMIEGRAHPTVLVAGMIHPFSGRRAEHDRLRRFVAAIDAIPGVGASLLQLPFETRSDAGIKTKLGKETPENLFLLEIKRIVK